MSTKSIVTAVLLIGLGIIFGVVLVSSFKGVDLTLAGGPVQLGSQSAPQKTNSMLQALNETNSAIAKELTPAVVYITVRSSKKSTGDQESNRFFHFFGPEFRFEMPRQQPEHGAGSGVVLTSDGYILTNNHVVQNADADGIEVTLWDKRKFRDAKLVGTDRFTDLAIIKINAKDLPAPRFGNSDEVEVGHIVYAFGNPLGLLSTMTQGIVSAVGRGQLNIIDDDRTGYGIENFIQTDAAVNPGNSGGALVNIRGEVIGINTAIATTNARFQGYSFAIPINIARKVASDLIAYGKVQRGFIGVRIENVDARIAKAVGFDAPRGVFVQEVNPNSAGEEAGVQSGDIILSVDGREVNSANELQMMIGSKAPGESVMLKIYRDKKTINKKVTLKPREDDENVIVSGTDKPGTDSRRRDVVTPTTVKVESIGLTMRNIDDKIKKEYGVDHGAFVETVDAGSESMNRGIAAKDIILSVGDEKITSASQLNDIIKRMKVGDAVLLRVKGSDKRTKLVAIEIPKR